MPRMRAWGSRVQASGNRGRSLGWAVLPTQRPHALQPTGTEAAPRLWEVIAGAPLSTENPYPVAATDTARHRRTGHLGMPRDEGSR